MYLARHIAGSRVRFSIRESFRDGDHYRSRELIGLGPDPSVYIVYPGGNAFYVEESLTDRLRALGVSDVEDGVEEIFWPFVDPRIRRRQAAFRDRAAAHRSRSALSAAEAARLRQETHLFDKRRVLFLRGGAMDQGNIGRMPAAMLRWLTAKSRDEIEQAFLEQERALKPQERKSYVFVIFNLGRHFIADLARTHPQVLDPAAVDEAFETDLCRLNGDDLFWAGEEGRSRGTLHPYLRRYAIMYYDGAYGPDRLMERIWRDFVDRHRFFRFPDAVRSVDYGEAGTVFGESADSLRAMDRRELTRLYRSKARRVHPDAGGSHEAFIRLTEAYRGLMRRKPRT